MTSCLFSKSSRAYESSCLHCAPRLQADMPLSSSLSQPLCLLKPSWNWTGKDTKVSCLLYLSVSFKCKNMHTRIWFACLITHKKTGANIWNHVWVFFFQIQVSSGEINDHVFGPQVIQFSCDIQLFVSSHTFQYRFTQNWHARDQSANIWQHCFKSLLPL